MEKTATILKLFVTSETPLIDQESIDLTRTMFGVFNQRKFYSATYLERVPARNFDYFCYVIIHDIGKLSEIKHEIDRTLNENPIVEKWHWEV